MLPFMIYFLTQRGRKGYLMSVCIVRFILLGLTKSLTSNPSSCWAYWDASLCSRMKKILVCLVLLLGRLILCLDSTCAFFFCQSFLWSVGIYVHVFIHYDVVFPHDIPWYFYRNPYHFIVFMVLVPWSLMMLCCQVHGIFSMQSIPIQVTHTVTQILKIVCLCFCKSCFAFLYIKMYRFMLISRQTVFVNFCDSEVSKSCQFIFSTKWYEICNARAL